MPVGAEAATANEPGELVVSTDAGSGGSGGGLEAGSAGAGGADLVSGMSLWKLQIPSVQAPKHVASKDKSCSWRRVGFTKVGLTRSRSFGPRGPSPSVEFLSPLPKRLKSLSITSFFGRWSSDFENEDEDEDGRMPESLFSNAGGSPTVLSAWVQTPNCCSAAAGVIPTRGMSCSICTMRRRGGSSFSSARISRARMRRKSARKLFFQ